MMMKLKGGFHIKKHVVKDEKEAKTHLKEGS